MPQKLQEKAQEFLFSARRTQDTRLGSVAKRAKGQGKHGHCKTPKRNIDDAEVELTRCCDKGLAGSCRNEGPERSGQGNAADDFDEDIANIGRMMDEP